MGDAEQPGEDLAILEQLNLVSNAAGTGAHQKREGIGASVFGCAIALGRDPHV